MTERTGPLDALNETDSTPAPDAEEHDTTADTEPERRPRPDIGAIIASGAVW